MRVDAGGWAGRIASLALLAAACGSTAGTTAQTAADAFTFPCRLPFAQTTGPGQWQGGFVDLPSGAFTADPNAPQIPGSYDRVVSRWLPVPRNLVAPDGLRYAYTTGGMGTTPGPPRLHIVDAATGVDKVMPLGLPQQGAYWVADYARDGIYIESGWEVMTYGFWRVDPTTGTLTDLGKQEHFIDDGTGRAWVSVFDSRDPHPAPSAMTGDPLPNEVGRRDLKTGAVAVWFYHPGFNVAFTRAFVGGGALIRVEPSLTNGGANGGHEYWLASAAGTARLIAHIESGGESVADSHGIWMGGSDGLYLITRDGQVKKMSSRLGNPGAGCL